MGVSCGLLPFLARALLERDGGPGGYGETLDERGNTGKGSKCIILPDKIIGAYLVQDPWKEGP